MERNKLLRGPSRVRFAVALLLTLAAAARLQQSSAPAQEKGPAQPNRHALLVGVSHYPHLADRFHLKGPANDVLLMRDLLLKQFAFPKDNVTVLSEEEGKKDEKQYPTRAAIKREFDRLAKVAQPGDQIVILMGGHGSQQPESEKSANPEPDGLDEIFLPRDVKEWSDEVSVVPNAIVDDEIGAWLKAIQAKNAFVWIIFDSCHSGTMIRGIKETERQISATTDLKVSKKAIEAAQERAARRSKQATRGGPATPERAPLPEGGIVAIYACQSTEVTVERELPPQSKDAKPYGLLTYTIVQILTQAHVNGSRPPTYREIVQLTNSRYAAMGRTAPTPQMEGGQDDRNREVLGSTSWSGRPSITLTEETNGWKINAGRLHGMREGTILAVKPLADQKNADKVIGHVRVEEVKMTSSMVAPCAFGDMKVREKLPEEARCEVAHVDFGMDKLRIAIDPLDAAGKPLPAEAIMVLNKSVEDVVGQAKTMLAKADAVEKADWLVRWFAGKVYLLPASEGFVKVGTGKNITLFGPYPANEMLASKLMPTFANIARTEAFKKLVGASGEVPRGASGGSVQVDLNLVRFPDPKDRMKTLPFPLEGGKVQVFDKDKIGLTVHNPNRFAIDVTILYIDSGFGIDPFFPDPSRGEINRIKSGETITLPTIELTADKTFGLENLVVIAIKATTKEPIDFSFMAQPTLEKATLTRSTKMPRSPLESLMENSLYGAGATRGISRAAVDDFTFRIIPWHLSPEARPKNK